MPKSANQKMKILYLLQYLWEKTDESHTASMADIIEFLESREISAERKSIYNDIQTLTEFGFDINLKKGHEGGYYIGARDFELVELKILADSVQASRFLSDKKTRALMNKLTALCSEPQAKQLRRQNLLSSSVRNCDETILYIVDTIHHAISGDRIISFKYFDIGENKEKVFRYGGSHMKTNPVALVWDDENYYLVAWDSKYETIRNYRVDHMADVSMTEEPRRQKERIDQIDLRNYTTVNFSMFNGVRTQVSIVFEKGLVGVMLDRFGKDLTIFPHGDDFFAIHPEVAVSPQFFGWIFGLAGKAYIESPDAVVEQMKAQIEAFSERQFS